MYTLKFLLLLLLLPCCLAAQHNKVVSPVYSDEYHRLIMADSASPAVTPGSRYNILTIKRWFDPKYGMQSVSVRRNTLRMQPYYPRVLQVSGSYNAGMALKTTNRLPALQTAYVQGRSEQGALTWRGPETNELFSFGPARASLEFDGQPYPWDINGKLVPAGTGNGHNATAYMNNIFRTGSLFSQSLSLQANLLENHILAREFSINLGQISENTFIRHHTSDTKNLDVSLGARIKWLHVAGKYTYAADRYSNANRNGFLNRTYQQAILTPVSFDNGQGYTLGTGQRSYSRLADNADFLLLDNGSYFKADRQQASLLVERNEYRKMKYRLTQSFDHKTENSSEGYKPGSAAFPGGNPLLRNKEDKLYQLKAAVSSNISYGRYDWSGSFSATYIFSAAQSVIRYQHPYNNYLYQRSTHEAIASYITWYDMRQWHIGLELGNKVYVSNTATHHNFFLPMADLSVKYLPQHSAGIELLFKTSFSRSDAELNIDKSLSYINLLRYNTEAAGSYFPVQEVSSFDQLAPVRHRNWSGSIGGSYKSRVTFTAGVFSHLVEQDLLPVYEIQRWVLKNAGSYQTNGIDIEVKLFDPGSRAHKLTTAHTLGFYAYKNKVTRVTEGRNYIPIAGFSDVYTTFIKGQPLGVITGSTWLRDADGHRVIGPDGFPLAAKDPGIIGNPNPDFVMKLNSMLRWKRFMLDAALEWKKGGDRWNGTQAVLDFYGRSQQSATDRTITNYIFPGVQMNGAPNKIPVDFYNPKLPVVANRWVRYGYSGVAEDYMEKADWLRLNAVKLSYSQPFKRVIQKLTLSACINNIMLWTPYSGVDPEQLLFDQTSSMGLDFFNLPATKTYGFNVSLQF
ncbi:hypothetical protein ACTJJ0_31445 [Chitinophaga sp. 22321]|uniref:TonB-linked outer membrane protein, SusC/RagA family n=1 Tax=Chitinophaga hostae TaxID=2831022 RepID=A0ABS5J9I6_9BACT|nr:hypothetical protein [Chitinophaga hostae]MBS0031876.1 hypothetical protein [Chitinophaga hostae]